MPRLVIVSNRVPVPRGRTQTAGGLAVALHDAVQRRDCLWFGWSGHVATGEASIEPHVTQVGQTTFATVDLTQSDYRGYYNGFANGMLWPLLHSRVGLSEFRRDDLKAYNAVNAAFAQTLAPLLRPDDLVWVHDYHLFPLGQAAARSRRKLPDRLLPACSVSAARSVSLSSASRRAFCAHWPPMIWWACRWRRMLTTSTLCFYGSTSRPAQLPFPSASIPIPWRRPPVVRRMGRRSSGWLSLLPTEHLILGVDRMDYSKGLPQRFRGFAQLLKRFPAHLNRVRYLQIAPVSRGEVGQYRALRRELDELVGRIDGEYADFDRTPLRYMTRSVSRSTIAGFYRLARVGLVTPLRDGMNLVAKEYVAAQNPDNPGVLVLSPFAGAAEELEGAILVNPYDPDEIAEALNAALIMPLEDRLARWRTMRDAVWQNTAATWAKRFLSELEQTQRLAWRVAGAGARPF